MILARQFLGVLDISLLITGAAAIIIICIIRKKCPTWVPKMRAWWEALKAKK